MLARTPDQHAAFIDDAVARSIAECTRLLRNRRRTERLEAIQTYDRAGHLAAGVLGCCYDAQEVAKLQRLPRAEVIAALRARIRHLVDWRRRAGADPTIWVGGSAQNLRAARRAYMAERYAAWCDRRQVVFFRRDMRAA